MFQSLTHPCTLFIRFVSCYIRSGLTVDYLFINNNISNPRKEGGYHFLPYPLHHHPPHLHLHLRHQLPHRPHHQRQRQRRTTLRFLHLPIYPNHNGFHSAMDGFSVLRSLRDLPTELVCTVSSNHPCQAVYICPFTSLGPSG